MRGDPTRYSHSLHRLCLKHRPETLCRSCRAFTTSQPSSSSTTNAFITFTTASNQSQSTLLPSGLLQPITSSQRSFPRLKTAESPLSLPRITTSSLTLQHLAHHITPRSTRLQRPTSTPTPPLPTPKKIQKKIEKKGEETTYTT